MTLPTWMFGNPEAIADRLIKKTERDELREAKRQRNIREAKRARIKALTKKAKDGI